MNMISLALQMGYDDYTTGRSFRSPLSSFAFRVSVRPAVVVAVVPVYGYSCGCGGACLCVWIRGAVPEGRGFSEVDIFEYCSSTYVWRRFVADFADINKFMKS